MTDHETCGVCGGDGRINTAHQTTSCPACRGSGRRKERAGFHDVTKTKPEHHEPKTKDGKKIKKTWPETALGITLANEVKNASIDDDQKAKLTQSIIDYEERKGEMTKTFSRLLRKQLRELTG